MKEILMVGIARGMYGRVEGERERIGIKRKVRWLRV